MNKIVFGNLGLLDIYLKDQRLISEGNELSLIGKEDYDTVEKLSSLEYPIYFTYHELLNNISYNKDLSYTKKLYYLEKIIETLDVLIQYIDDYKDEDSRICYIIDGIYERYETVKSQTVYTWGEQIIFLFDDIVDGFRTASKYLYFNPPLYPLMYLKPGETLDDEGECESYSESDDESQGTSNDSESCDESSVDSNNDDSNSDSEEKELSEVDFEGVEYLEDESTGEIYNASHQLVGEWNEEGDDIIWKSSAFKKTHYNLVKQKSLLDELD